MPIWKSFLFNYIISKNILEKEFTTGISYFPVSVKKLLNIPWHAKNNSVQNQGHKQHVIVNMLFQKVIHGNIVNKVINGNIVNMMLKIIEYPIYNRRNLPETKKLQKRRSKQVTRTRKRWRVKWAISRTPLQTKKTTYAGVEHVT